MKPKRVTPYIIPCIVIGLFSYTLCVLIQSDPEGARTFPGIIGGVLLLVLILMQLIWVISLSKAARQNSRLLYQHYPELRHGSVYQHTFTFRNFFWELFLYKSHLISRQGRFSVIDLRDIASISLMYRIETGRNYRRKVYYLTLVPNASLDNKTHRIDLQSEAINDFEEEIKKFFKAIRTHFPGIKLEDERRVSRRKSDNLLNPWRNRYWFELLIALVFAAIALSPFRRAELVSNDKITIGIFGILAILVATWGILRLRHNLKVYQQLTTKCPEILGGDLVGISDWEISDLHLYRYKDVIFRQAYRCKLVDLREVAKISFVIKPYKTRSGKVHSPQLIFEDARQKELATFDLQNNQHPIYFANHEKAADLLNWIKTNYPAIEIIGEDKLKIASEQMN